MNYSQFEYALSLIAEGEYAVLRIEVAGEWIELIRERLDSPFSHIIEPYGVEVAINTPPVPTQDAIRKERRTDTMQPPTHY